MGAIYALIDPLTEEIRYIGWTSAPLPSRLRYHLTTNVGRRNGRTYRIKWIRSLKRVGLQPRITLVQVVPDTGWQDAERYWIAYFRSLGCPLTNGTTGGDGVRGYVPSKEHRRAVGEAATARWQVWRAKGLSMPDETRAMISAKNSGRKHSAEARAKMSQSGRGRPKSPEHRERIRQALLGRKQSTEHREKTVANAFRANRSRWNKEV